MSSVHNSAINIEGLSFLIADPNPHSAAIIHNILRGFGATRVMDARTIRDTIRVLIDQTVDILLVDPQLEKGRGLELIRSIRTDPKNPCRAMPILVVTGDTQTSAVKSAKDAGANMVVAKPVSTANFYERLNWVARNTENHLGPKRPSKNEEAACTALSQSEVDNLFQEAAAGGSSLEGWRRADPQDAGRLRSDIAIRMRQLGPEME